MLARLAPLAMLRGAPTRRASVIFCTRDFLLGYRRAFVFYSTSLVGTTNDSTDPSGTLLKSPDIKEFASSGSEE